MVMRSFNKNYKVIYSANPLIVTKNEKKSVIIRAIIGFSTGF